MDWDRIVLIANIVGQSYATFNFLGCLEVNKLCLCLRAEQDRWLNSERNILLMATNFFAVKVNSPTKTSTYNSFVKNSNKSKSCELMQG